jgi:hypothetical protein
MADNKTLKWLTPNTFDKLSVAKVNETVDIPNDHAIFDEQQLELWRNIAQALSVPFDDTGYTLTLVYFKDKDESAQVFPHLCLDVKGVPVLRWGNFSLDLNKSGYEVHVNERLQAAIYLGDSDLFDEGHFISVKAYFKSDVTAFDVNRAINANKWEKVLAPRMQYIKLADVVGQTLDVYGYKPNKFDGFDLETSKGRLSANSAIKRVLRYEPEITPDKPATLIVGEQTGTTPQGHAMVDVKLLTWAAQQAEVFTFG